MPPIGVHRRSSAVEPSGRSADELSPADLDALTEQIIGCAFVVANGLGCGFLEKVYENALRIELEAAGLSVRQQHPTRVVWRDDVVGDDYADLLVANCVVVELKAIKDLDDCTWHSASTT